MNSADTRVLMAQLETKTGDLDGNTAQIISIIKANQRVALPSQEWGPESYNYTNVADVPFVVFHELAITGYNNGALFENEEFIAEAESKVHEIAQHVGDEVVIVGCPRFAHPKLKRNGNLRLHNSVFVLHQGKVVGVYDKIHLANDFQHEDRKYFYPGKNTLVLTINGVTFGVLNCEDIWKKDHERDLLGEMKHNNPGLEVVFCLNYSYYTYEKQDFRETLIKTQAKENNVAIVYLNAVGIGDIVKNMIAYDGNSFVMNAEGIKIAQMGSYRSDLATCNWTNSYDVNAHVQPYLKTKGRHRSEAWVKKYHSLLNAHLFSMPRIMGNMKAFVAVSGGVDSAVVSVLAAKSMGPANCVFVSMPSQYNGNVTKGAAKHVVDAVGGELLWCAIEDTSRVLIGELDRCVTSQFTTGVDSLPSAQSMVRTTLDATIRSSLALALCHHYKAGIVSTGNHTENILGWCTFHDIGSIGVYQPIGDMTKTELFEFCEFLNWHYGEELIPEGLFNGQIKPMAELADNAGGADPFDYYLMSGICAEIIRHRRTPKQLKEMFTNHTLCEDYFPLMQDATGESSIYDKYDLATFMASVKQAWRLSKISVFKSAQHAPCLILSPRSRGFSSRETIFNFYIPNEGLE